MNLREFYKVLDDFCNSEEMQKLNNGPAQVMLKNPTQRATDILTGRVTSEKLTDEEIQRIADRIVDISGYWGSGISYAFNCREFLLTAMKLRDMLKMLMLSDEVDALIEKI